MGQETEAARLSLPNRTLTDKVLFSAFLVIIGCGYLMALSLIYYTDAGRDGKPGLSIQDIADDYYGNRSGTRLEAAIRGPMAPHLSLDERNEIVAWLKSGELQSHYSSVIKPILSKDCTRCHSPASGMGLPDLSNYAGVQQVAHIDTGQSLHSLVRLSHIHLFGIALLLLGVGLIFRHARIKDWLKNGLIVLPFIAMFIDVLAWFLTKWDPVYAYTVVIAGAILGLSLAAQILISLYQMWLSCWFGQKATE